VQQSSHESRAARLNAFQCNSYLTLKQTRFRKIFGLLRHFKTKSAIKLHKYLFSERFN
jgi:hypothetical protein